MDIKDYKPAKFCWCCGRKMWGGNKPVVKVIDGEPRTMHKYCSKHIEWMSQVKDQNNALDPN